MWFRNLVRIPTRRPTRAVFQARPLGRRPRGRPRPRWIDYISTLALDRLGIPPSELVNLAQEREVWVPLLEMLPPDKRFDDEDKVIYKKFSNHPS